MRLECIKTQGINKIEKIKRIMKKSTETPLIWSNSENRLIVLWIMIMEKLVVFEVEYFEKSIIKFSKSMSHFPKH